MPTPTDFPVLLLILPLLCAAASLASKLAALLRPHRIHPPPNGSALPGLLLVIPPILWIAGTTAILLLTFRTIAQGNDPESVLGGWAVPLGVTLQLDGTAWLGSLSVLVVGATSYFYGLTAGERSHEFAVFFFFMVAAFEGILLTRDIFSLFVFLEIMALSAYMLIGLERKPAALLASFRYLIVGTVSIAFYLIGVYIFYRLTGNLSYDSVVLATSDGGPAVSLGLSCIIIGCGVRAAYVPLHGWLPSAHASAPTYISSILSGIMPKIPLFALLRLISAAPAVFSDLLVYTGAVTAVYGVYKALQQRDAKRLLAFHTVSQMGYVTADLGAAIGSATTGECINGLGGICFIYYSLAHGLFKALLFLVVGIVVLATGSRSIYRLHGLYKKMPWATVLFIGGALSIVGVPPWIGYAGKFMTTKAVASPLAVILLGIASVGTAGSLLKLGSIFFRRESGPEPIVRRVPSLVYAAPSILAALCLGIGLFPHYFEEIIGQLIHCEGIAKIALNRLYAPESVIKSLLLAAAGVPVYFMVISQKGRKITAMLRSHPAGSTGDLLAMLLSVAGYWLLAAR